MSGPEEANEKLIASLPDTGPVVMVAMATSETYSKMTGAKS